MKPANQKETWKDKGKVASALSMVRLVVGSKCCKDWGWHWSPRHPRGWLQSWLLIHLYLEHPLNIMHCSRQQGCPETKLFLALPGFTDGGWKERKAQRKMIAPVLNQEYQQAPFQCLRATNSGHRFRKQWTWPLTSVLNRAQCLLMQSQLTSKSYHSGIKQVLTVSFYRW